MVNVQGWPNWARCPFKVWDHAGSQPEVNRKLKMILLRLPMTKGVVKCIDTVETFLQENLNMQKESFKIFWFEDAPDQWKGRIKHINLKLV